MATSWTQADIDALEAAIKGGVLSVRFENREVQKFGSISEALKLLQHMKDAVATATSSAVTRTTYGVFNKGRRRRFRDD